jgi:hypothetical protein
MKLSVRAKLLAFSAVALTWLFPLTLLAAEDDPGYFEAALQAFADWLLCWLVTLLKPELKIVLDAIPKDWLPDFTGVVWWIEVANYWTPLDWVFSLLLIYLTIELTWTICLFFYRLLPLK